LARCFLAIDFQVFFQPELLPMETLWRKKDFALVLGLKRQLQQGKK
jgi:hypothetical protein